MNKGHGRIEGLTVITSEMLNAYAAWPGLAQVYRLEREFPWWRKGVCYKTSCEVEFGMTSLSRKKATPYRRDVTLREDATRFTIGNRARVMANLNNLILALIRQTGFTNAGQDRRFFAAHLSAAFSILVTSFS